MDQAGILVASRLSPDARCAYCHDALGELSTVCGGCRTALHASCRAELALCPTLGCRESTFDLLGPVARLQRIRARSIRPGFRRALARFRQRQDGSGRLASAATPGEGDDFTRGDIRPGATDATESVRVEIGGLREFLADERARDGSAQLSEPQRCLRAIFRACAGEILADDPGRRVKPMPFAVGIVLLASVPLWLPCSILFAATGYATIVFPVVAGAAWLQLLPLELEFPQLDRLLRSLRASRAIAWFLAPIFPFVIPALLLDTAPGPEPVHVAVTTALVGALLLPGVVAWYRGRVSWTARRVGPSPRPGGE